MAKSKLKVLLRGQNRIRTIVIHVPERWVDVDWRELANQVPPYTGLEERFKTLLLSLEEGQKTVPIRRLPYKGPADEITSDRWNGTRHYLVANEIEYLCPCNAGGTCLRPKGGE